MAEGNGDQPGTELPDPVRRAMLVSAHLHSEHDWWTFSVAAFSAAPTPGSLKALMVNAHDLARTAQLALKASEELVEWIEQKRKEGRGA